MNSTDTLPASLEPRASTIGEPSMRDAIDATSSATDGLKTKAKQIQQAATERIQDAVATVDDYAHENPWVVLGSFAAVGLLLGVILGLRGRR